MAGMRPADAWTRPILQRPRPSDQDPTAARPASSAMLEPVSDSPALRLVACDLDGTLLRPGGALPDGTAEVLAALHGAGALFVPASGRSAHSVTTLFDGLLPHDGAGPTLIADNGACIVHRGERHAPQTLPGEVVERIVSTLRARTRPSVTVLCAPDMAYVEAPDGPLLDQVRGYYTALTRVEDLLDVDDRLIKIAVADLEGIADVVDDVLAPHAARVDVVRSGEVWADVMPRGVSKGSALTWLQCELGVGVEETAAFGDHLNDVEMLRVAGHSYAVADAQPEVAAIARHTAPSHLDDGVLTVLRGLLDDDLVVR